MVRKIKNENGYTSVFMCLMMPLIIMIVGISIDSSMLIYYREKLMMATKISAISASSFYDIEDGEIKINFENAEDAAIRSLEKNFIDATFIEFKIDDEYKNECTVKARFDSPIYFMKVAEVFGLSINEITLNESYTARRSLNDGGS